MQKFQFFLKQKAHFGVESYKTTYRHKAVRCRGKSRKHLLALSFSACGSGSDIGPDNEPLDDARIIALACDDLTIALRPLRSCLASVKP
jgi:hypothetical protein